MNATRAYDYMVVGAGSAGGVPAHCRSEDADASLLLLEADDSNRQPCIQTPLGVGPIRPQHCWTRQEQTSSCWKTGPQHWRPTT